MAVATLKKDGMFFLAGLTVGIFIFGENIDHLFQNFWNSSYMGRFTLPEFLGLPIGIIVFLIVIMALLLFWLVEYVEDQVNVKNDRRKNVKQKLTGAAVLVGMALFVMFKGQPTVEQKWERISEVEQPRIDNRDVQIASAELLGFIKNDLVRTVLIDVRDESDFNLFHLVDAQHEALSDIPEKAEKEYLHSPANTLFVVMSNDEGPATEAWKLMRAQGIVNVYILENGVNGWLDTFNNLVEESDPLTRKVPSPVARELAMGDEELRYRFQGALGSNYAVADPTIHDHAFEYTPKVKMKVKKASGGG